MTVKNAVTPEMMRAVFAELGHRGGIARAKVLSPARRKAIAIRAATIRWYKLKGETK
jgi:hypothetical protein